MKLRIITLLTFILISLQVFSGCSREDYGVVLNVGTTLHNGMYNPLYASTSYDEDVCNLVFQGLVDRTEDGLYEINSLLVESMEISPDGKSYTFKLKDGILFSDSTPLTPEDIVFTYKTLADPSSTAYKREIIHKFRGGTDYVEKKTTDFTLVEALDPQTIVFNFQYKDRANLEYCGVKILPQAYYPGWAYDGVDGVMYEKLPSPMGSGPYVVTEVVHGKSVMLQYNPAYWGGEEETYSIDTLNIKFYQEKDYQAALETGEVDFIPEIGDRQIYLDITKGQTDLGDKKDLVFDFYENNQYGYIVFNTEGSFIRSANLRRAMAYGFNREKFISDYFVNGASLTNAPLPPNSMIYQLLGTETMDNFTYDVEKARELLASVNYTWSEDGKMYLSENQVKLKFLATPGNPIEKEITTRFVEDMKVLGIEIEIDTMPYSEIESLIRQKGSDWSMAFVESYWHSDDPSKLFSAYATASIPKTNISWYSNIDVDSLLTSGQREMDITTVSALNKYKEGLIIINSEVPDLPIYNLRSTTVKRNTLEGIKQGAYNRWSEDVSAVKFATT